MYNWINNIVWTFSKWFLLIAYSRTIDLFKYIVNIVFINNSFILWLEITSSIFYCIITFYFFFNSKTNVVTNLNPLNSDNKPFKSILIADSKLQHYKCLHSLNKHEIDLLFLHFFIEIFLKKSSCFVVSLILRSGWSFILRHFHSLKAC